MADRDWPNILCKWRTHFAGWQLGTRPKGEPECDAVRDHREVTMLLRAEASAIVRTLIEKGYFTAEEFTENFNDECRLLNQDYEARFAGITASEVGLHYDVQRIHDAGTMLGWKP